MLKAPTPEVDTGEALPLLDVRDLTVEFQTRRGTVQAVKHVNISLAKGETLGIVGESGSGKSVTSYAVMRILDRAGRIADGSVRFSNLDLRQIDESVNNIENLIQDKEVVSAVVNGEAVDVRFSQFFLNPPKDLKAFMPTEFNKESNYKKNAYGTYRNYRAGSPVGWNLEAYRRYFPDVKSNEDIKRAARILGQSWGGALVGAPLTSFIM